MHVGAAPRFAQDMRRDFCANLDAAPTCILLFTRFEFSTRASKSEFLRPPITFDACSNAKNRIALSFVVFALKFSEYITLVFI